MKCIPLLALPPTVTITFPVVAPLGTVAMMLVSLQLVTVAPVPLNVTVLVPWAAANPVPVIVTDVPAKPPTGERPVMLGTTEKLTPLLGTTPAMTTTFPVLAAAGTGTTMLVILQLVGVAVVPLNVTPPDPCVAPKLDPLMVTDVPVVPDVGEGR